MSSMIIKFFMGILAMFVAHRLITIVFTIALGFLVYKYFTDPKFFKQMSDIFSKNLPNIPSMEVKKPSLKDF